MIPFHFLLGALALAIPFVAHASIIQIDGPWALGYAYAVALPAFLALVLLLHMLSGQRDAYIAASMPALGGLLAALATLLAGAIPTGLDPALLAPSAVSPLATGLALSLATGAATIVFEFWHKEVRGAPLLLVFIAAAITGLLAHGLFTAGASAIGIPLPGAGWPVIVAVPLVAGLAPSLFVAVYAEGLVADLAPLVGRSRQDEADGGPGLDIYREADERFRSALSEGQDAARAYRDLAGDERLGVFFADARGHIVYANQSLARMLATEPHDLTDRHAGELFFGRDRAPAPPRLGMNGASEGYRSIVTVPGERERFLSVRLEEVDGGAVRGEVADLTEEVLRREAREHRRRLAFTLELLTSDLPNYLVAPLSNIEAVETADGLSQHHRDAIQRARRCLEQLDQRLDRLTAITRSIEEDATSIQLDEIVRRAAEAHLERHPEAPRIHWNLPEAPMFVHGTPDLETAIGNLLENAYQHAGQEAMVTVAGYLEDGGWTLAIEDDGPGVPHELKGRIFNGFTQGSDGRGKGLGLYLARSIVTGLGGRIWVEDRVRGEPSSGASFRIWLPRARSSEARPTPETTTHPHATREASHHDVSLSGGRAAA